MKKLTQIRVLGNCLKLFSLNFLVLMLVNCDPKEPKPRPVNDSYKKKLITKEEAHVLFDEYSKTNNIILTKSRNGNPDSRWYWFSLEEMEGYIQYVKKNAEKQKLKDVGIRIYMGKYPEDHPKDRMAKPHFGGYQTIFLMPTVKNKKAFDENSKLKRTDFEDENKDLETIQPMNMTNLSPPPNSLTNTMN